MTSDRRRLANTLMNLALAAAPPERRVWAEAMSAEIAHLPEHSAQAFALGCLWAALHARAASPAFILHATQWVLVLGAIGWSAGNLWLAGRFTRAGADLPAAVAYASAAIYASGGLLTAMLGLRATVVLATPLLLLVGLVAAGAQALLPPSPYDSLYRALALEQSALLVIVLLLAGGVPKWVSSRDGGYR